MTLKVFLSNSMHCLPKYEKRVLFQVMHLSQIKQKTKPKDCILRYWETVNKFICGRNKKKETDAKTWTYCLCYNWKNWSENKNQEFYLLKGFFAFIVEMMDYL